MGKNRETTLSNCIYCLLFFSTARACQNQAYPFTIGAEHHTIVFERIFYTPHLQLQF